MFKEKVLLAALIIAAGLVGWAAVSTSAEIHVSPIGQHAITAFERGPNCWVDLGVPPDETDAPAAALFVELFEDRLTLTQFFESLGPVIGEDPENLASFLASPLTEHCGLAQDEQASS